MSKDRSLRSIKTSTTNSFRFFQHVCLSISQFPTPFLQRGSLHTDIVILPSPIQQQRPPHILLLTHWFELLQTGLIQTASGQHYVQQFLIPNCVSGEHIPTEIQHAAVFLSNSSCAHAVCINSLTHSHLLSAQLDLIPRQSNLAITQNSRSKQQSPDFYVLQGDKIQRAAKKPHWGILFWGALLSQFRCLFQIPSASLMLAVWLEMQRHTARLLTLVFSDLDMGLKLDWS